MKILNTIPMSRNNCIIFPCRYKTMNDGIEEVIDDNGRVIKNDQFYLCNPDDFENALVTLSYKYKSEKIRIFQFTSFQRSKSKEQSGSGIHT